ncbi:MAG: helix-turn-helix transcriptional regulator [Bacteroidia bacterium]
MITGMDITPFAKLIKSQLALRDFGRRILRHVFQNPEKQRGFQTNSFEAAPVLAHAYQQSLVIDNVGVGFHAMMTQSTVVTRSTGKDKAFLKEVENWIKEELKERKPDVESLASKVHLSSRQLSRKLKALTGFSPAKYIKEVQLQAARKELERNSSLSISEVAYKYGYEHPSTFSRVFKKRFGTTPSKYGK